MLRPSRESFEELRSSGQPVPLVWDMLADLNTPVSVYWKLGHDAIHSFLLESVTGGDQVSRYSFIGARPKSVVRVKNGRGVVKTPNSQQEVALQSGQDALDLVKAQMPAVPVPIEGLPKLLGGAVGVIGYDFVRALENLPDSNPDDLNFDDVAMMMCTDIVAFDHARSLIRIIALANPTDTGFDDAVARMEAIRDRLMGPLPPLPGAGTGPGPVTPNMTQAEFEAAVVKVVEYLHAGDGLQMVPSQRFSTPCDAHPLSVYRCLRTINPSPYMFLFRFGDFDVVGASPELHVGLDGTTARLRPIAGTRWRGKNEAEDRALGEELLADPKERAEHVMLVDLGRNDLGRVCEVGSVKVTELMVIERYSHVMHIVSNVTGRLRPEFDAFDLLRATFPAGTVSGAPKVRAMQIIDEVEKSRRGLYAGAVGYFAASGDADTAIALRTILIKDGTAHVQAGGGVVADSQPTYEYQESCNKAKAALRSIELAQTGDLFS